MSDISHWAALLKDPSPRIRAATLRRLGEEGGPEVGPLIEALKQDRDELVKTVAEEVHDRWRERHPPPPPPPPVRDAPASTDTANLAGIAAAGGSFVGGAPRPAAAAGGAPAGGSLAALGAGQAPRLVDPRKIALDVLRPSIQKLLELCHSGSYELSKAAVGTLGAIRDWSTVDALLELLENEALNAEVADALALIGDYRAVEPLIKVIESGKWSNPKAIILALGGFRTRSATLQLVRFLASSNPEIRAHACQALQSFTYDQDVELSLLNALSDPEEQVVLSALMALRDLDSEHTVQRLVDLFRGHPNEKVKATIFTALHNSTHELFSILAIVEEALADPADRVRANAIECVGHIDVDPSALRTLLAKAANDSNNRVRANVAIAYGKIDAREAVSILSDMISDPDRRVRASAVYAARFIESDRVALWLLSTLTVERSEDVLRLALDGLEKVGGDGIVDRLLGLLSNPNPIVREGIVRALATKSDKRVGPALISRFAVDDDPAVCAAIVKAVGQLGGGEYTSFLTEALRTSDTEVQAAAIDALKDLARLEIISSLEPFLTNPVPQLRAKASLALWNLGQLDVHKHIHQMLMDPRSTPSVMAAIEVLGEVGAGLNDLKETRLVHLTSSLKNHEEALPVTEAPVGPVPSRPPTSPGQARVISSEVPIEEMDAVMNLMAMGEATMAIELADKACEDHSEDPLASYLAGKVRLRAKQTLEAAGAFRSSQEATDTFFPSSLNLARISQTSGDLDGAFESFLEAFERKSKMIRQQIEITRQLLQEKRSEEVSAMIKELLAQMPLEGGVYLKLGIRFLKAKRFEEAFDYLRRAYAFDGDNNAVRFNLALACYHMGKGKECKLLCNRVIKSSAQGSAEAQRALHLLELL